ncbi:hypothetical protein MFRU_011g00940 [Monilinia fructicola]|uniref:DUF202 domain-containing protein n=1 Tax=Monilinia fructicola TaxID=38448 RepID=A0A5M9JMW7_MONFR|nr:hypothetical protein EYC84_000239 [Monilinia fructicola]KAG4030636.1 hypothetical protein MFRU_011g00940 [Monilinia fructicola]
MSRIQEEEGQESQQEMIYSPIYFPARPPPIDVANHHGESVFCTPPLLGPLLFDNVDSDCRDHCANERTFLSYLRLSMYMTIVSLAIILSFHLKSTPTQLELRMAQPLGILFWVLSLVCLALGFGNYMKTVNKYSRRVAIVQSGWKTQGVLTTIAVAIIAVCVLFLATSSKRT